MKKEQLKNVNFEKVQVTFTTGEVLEYTRAEDGSLKLPEGSEYHSLLIGVSAKAEDEDDSTLIMQLRHTGGCGFMTTIITNIIDLLGKTDALGPLKELDDKIKSVIGSLILRKMGECNCREQEPSDD